MILGCLAYTVPPIVPSFKFLSILMLPFPLQKQLQNELATSIFDQMNTAALAWQHAKNIVIDLCMRNM